MSDSASYTHEFICSFMECPNTSLEDVLRFIEFIPMNVWIGCQENAIILLDIIPRIEAEAEVNDMLLMHVSKRLLKCFGSIGMQSDYLTLIDSVEQYHNHDGPCEFCKSKITCLQMTKAMKAAGFLQTHELSHFTCLESIIITMNSINRHYGYNHDCQVPEFKYQTLRERHEPLTEDLAKYLHHPKKLEKWLIENPDKHVEDYLP